MRVRPTGHTLDMKFCHIGQKKREVSASLFFCVGAVLRANRKHARTSLGLCGHVGWITENPGVVSRDDVVLGAHSEVTPLEAHGLTLHRRSVVPVAMWQIL